ncbi:uncharacterized protein LOC143428220 [Xylocopa sonorina]|uniref:uncharacterized protein LOC143428220 n=1 Tax=Xylocopa sonorina TaxID=1818115 RepID=UPI00403AEB40
MSIDQSFYTNVFLLMQAVPPSFECTKCFKEGMFNKPNTIGFIHISHYLLSVYNAQRFQKMVLWPLMNKVDERRYREEVREYLEIVASENPDINFLPILKSRLLQAGGTKFLIFMWKISLISLRAYISRECDIHLLRAPSSGDSNDIIQTYFNITNRKRDNAIFTLLKQMKSNLKTFDYYMQCKSLDLKEVQTAIFNVKEKIESNILTLPLSALIAKRLLNIDDTGVINLWKKSIQQNIKYLRHKNAKLKEVKNLSNKLHNLISNLCINSEFFDGNNLTTINIEALPLTLKEKIQPVDSGLYRNSCLVLQALLSLIDQALQEIEYHFKIDGLPNLLNWETTIFEHCKIIKSTKESFHELIMQISDDLYDVQCSLQKKTMNRTLDISILYPMNLKVILVSPKLKFSIDERKNDRNILLHKLLCSPLQGKYKQLFKRYKRSLFDSPKKRKSNNSTGIIHLNRESPQRHLLICNRSSPITINERILPPRYSKLFSPELKRNYIKGTGTTAVSTPKSLQTNTIAKKSNVSDPNKEIDTLLIVFPILNLIDDNCKEVPEFTVDYALHNHNYFSVLLTSTQVPTAM